MSVITWNGIQYNSEQKDLPKDLKELLSNPKKVQIVEQPQPVEIPKKDKRR